MKCNIHGDKCPYLDKEILAQELLLCSKGWRNTPKKINLFLGEWCLKLAEEIITRQWRPRYYTCFVVRDPKPREVFAPHPADRLLQRWLVKTLLPVVLRRLMPHSWACLPGRGTHAAVKKLRQWLRNPQLKYYLKADLQNFFYSVNKKVLLAIVERHLEKSNFCSGGASVVSYVTRRIITHHPVENVRFSCSPALWKYVPPEKTLFNIPTDRGIPLGNYTSQLFANIYLNELDRYVVHNLGLHYYMRYMDDFIVLSASHHKLQEALKQIENFLRNILDLQLHPQKRKICLVKYGIDFCGYVVWSRRILARHSTIKRIKNRIAQIKMAINGEDVHLSGNSRLDKLVRESLHKYPDNREYIYHLTQCSRNGILGYLSIADSENLQKSIFEEME